MCDSHAIDQRILAARRKLAEAAPRVADGLIDLALNSKSEEVRRRAQEAVLDRAGLRPGLDVQVTEATFDGGRSPGDILRERLAAHRMRTIEGEIATTSAEEELSE